MVVITGSSGFIGHHLMKAFPDAVGIDNVDRGHKHNWIKTDLRDYDTLFWQLKDLGVKTILHQAAIPSVPDSYADPLRTYTNNVTGSLNLIKIAKIIGVEKFVFASSSSVLGPSPYGHSKKIIEDVLKHTGVPYTVLRYFNVFGYGQRSNILDLMHKALKNDLPLTIFGDGETTRDFTYVDNVVTANIKAISNQYDGQVLEVGTGEPRSLNEVYATLKARLNPDHTKLFYGPDRVGDIKFSKALTFLSKFEITPFEVGLNKWLTQTEQNLAVQEQQTMSM